MYIGIIDPKKDGNVVFHNKGTSIRLVNYLKHEEEQEAEPRFFNDKKDHFSGEEVLQQIDNNVKGLKAGDDKFYSIYIAPSEKELQHIQNDNNALIRYTKKVMENYASNFNLKNNTKLPPGQLVWFATIHHDREIKNIDLVQENLLSKKEQKVIDELRGKNDPNSDQRIRKIYEKAKLRNENRFDRNVFKIGDKKPGLNKHVHIVVSARNRDQTITLNPQTRQSRFNIRSFQSKSCKDFNELFHYKGKTIQDGFYQKYNEKEKDYFDNKIKAYVDQINQHIKEKLDVQKFREIGEQNSYSRAFFINLTKLKYRFISGEPVNDAYFFAARGRDMKPSDYDRINFYKDGHHKGPENNNNSHLSPFRGSPAANKLAKAVNMLSRPYLVNETFHLSVRRKAYQKQIINTRNIKDQGMERS